MTVQFHVGQKVVCINDSKNNFRKCQLVKGRIYVVSKAYLSPMNNLIIESDEFEGGWYASRFRPVVERKTSIEIFTAMLNEKSTEIVGGQHA